MMFSRSIIKNAQIPTVRIQVLEALLHSYRLRVPDGGGLMNRATTTGKYVIDRNLLLNF